MKLALIFFSVLSSLSLWFAPQRTQPVKCPGKPLSIKLLPGPKMTGPSLPLRFGGTRELPNLGVFSEEAFRQVIKNRDEFNDLWKRLTARIPPDNSVPSPPEIDFSKEMVVVAAMGQRPSSGYWIIIDGACESNGQVEVFVSNVEEPACAGHGIFTMLTYPSDIVRLPQIDLPIVFHETQMSCTEWHDQFRRGAPPGM